MAMVTGDSKNNWLIGTGDADTIKGLGGNDTLKGGGGADTLNGGTGIDTALYLDSPEGVLVDLEWRIAHYGTAEGDTLSSIENIYGSSYGDYLSGDSVDNTLVGLDGDDVLSGRSGLDMLDGGYGHDFLNGGAGADTLNGGEGFDEALYTTSAAGVFVALISNFASGGDADGDTLSSIESLGGSEFSDHLWGDNSFNGLRGFGGDDTLKGYGGSDGLFGGEGHDTLYGMDGDDGLWGDAGNDLLVGGAGPDGMLGGLGADTFVWSSIDDTDTTPAAADVIYDFNRAEGDRLDLSDVDADVYAAGNQAFTFIGAAPFSGTPGEINYVHQNGETIIQMQTGTSADVEGIIRIYGIVTPEASWFVL